MDAKVNNKKNEIEVKQSGDDKEMEEKVEKKGTYKKQRKWKKGEIAKREKKRQ